MTDRTVQIELSEYNELLEFKAEANTTIMKLIGRVTELEARIELYREDIEPADELDEKLEEDEDE